MTNPKTKISDKAQLATDDPLGAIADKTDKILAKMGQRVAGLKSFAALTKTFCDNCTREHNA